MPPDENKPQFYGVSEVEQRRERFERENVELSAKMDEIDIPDPEKPHVQITVKPDERN